MLDENLEKSVYLVLRVKQIGGFAVLCSKVFIRPSKTGRIMLSPVAGGRAASPILCPEHISKTMLATVMKLHGWIDLIKAECSAQEP